MVVRFINIVTLVVTPEATVRTNHGRMVIVYVFSAYTTRKLNNFFLLLSGHPLMGSSQVDRKSITGYYFTLSRNGPAISWKSKRQQTVALSSCESEYMALTATTQEALYLSNVMGDFIREQTFTPVNVFSDNQGAIALSKHPVHHHRTKHIDIRYHFIRDNINNNNIEISYVPTANNIADLMTKPCSKVKLRTFKRDLFGCSLK